MRLAKILNSEFFKINEKIKDELKKELEGGFWALCLGAGVSQSCDLPGWNTLLSKMMSRMTSLYSSVIEVEKADLNKDDLKIANEIRNKIGEHKFDSVFLGKIKKSNEGEYSQIMDGMNPLEAAEYMEQFIEFFLYPTENKDKKGKIQNEMIKEIIYDSCKINSLPEEKELTTLRAIVELMTVSKPKIRIAFTYNYDDLLEEGLKKYKPEIVHDNVCSFVSEDNPDLSDKNSKDDNWKIVHFHGRIPMLKNSTENRAGKIILTESSYYEEESMGYSFANVLQSFAMNNYNLIYIGFSGSDYSFRRIIKNLPHTGQNHKYIFFCVDDIVKSVLESVHKNEIKNKVRRYDEILENMGESDNSFEQIMINQLLSWKRRYWKEHGLTVIFSTLEELPKDIEELAKG